MVHENFRAHGARIFGEFRAHGAQKRLDIFAHVFPSKIDNNFTACFPYPIRPNLISI